MIKCDQEPSMKNIAELLQKRRRPRRTFVEHRPKESHQSDGVVESAHCHLGDRCERKCEITAGTVVGQTLCTGFDEVCKWS